MKKRIFALALVVGILLSLSASAWAENAYYSVTKVEAEYSKIYKVTERAGKAFTIRVRAMLENGNSGSNPEANKIVWSIAQDDRNPIENLDISLSEDTKGVTSEALPASGGTTITAYFTGTIKTSGDVTITAALYKDDAAATDVGTGDSLRKASGTATVQFRMDTDKEDEGTADGTLFSSDGQSFDIEEDDPEPEDEEDPRGNTGNVDSEEWDGIDPTYPNSKYTSWTQRKTLDKKSGKPKLKTTKVPAFTASTSGDTTITILGASPTVNVGIAGKDAVKLFGLDTSAKDTFIPLDKANIKKYGIPFRVTSYDINSDDEGKASKNASSTVTLAFNGAYVSYKGFPLTFQIANGNTGSKPVTKSIKIDVNPTTATPSWVAPTLHISDSADEGANSKGLIVKTTYNEDEVVADEELYYAIKASSDYEAEGFEYETDDVEVAIVQMDVDPADLPTDDDEDGEGTEGNTMTRNFEGQEGGEGEEETPAAAPEEKIVVYSPDETGEYVIDGESYDIFYISRSDPTITVEFWGTTTDSADDYIKSVTFSSESPDYKVSFDTAEITKYTYTMDYSYVTDDEMAAKNKGVELVVAVSKGNTDITETTYTVSGSAAPYVITVKPELSKVKNGVKYEITQPTYNGYGEVEEHGYVTVFGKLENYEKETKTALTLTATAANKKKAALKVNVIGKTAPIIDDKTKTKLKETKAVEAGKVPSVKVKAKGSKTITYDVPSAEDQAKLAALGLTFDSKKGALAAVAKGVTNPTSEDGAYKTFTVTLRAVNDAGEDTAPAIFGITGAAPKYTTKTMTFTAGTKGYQSIQPNAGKTAVTADSPVAFTYKEDGSNLSSNGLAIVDWKRIEVETTSTEYFKSGDVVVSVDATLADGTELGTYSGSDTTGSTAYTAGYFTSGTDNYRLVTGEVKVDANDENKLKASGDVYVVYVTLTADETPAISEDKVQTISDDASRDVAVWVVSPDESLKHALIIQVTNPSKLTANGLKAKKVKVNILTTNLGSKEVKGGITITINPNTNSSARNTAANGTATANYSTARNGNTARSGKGGGSGSGYDGTEADEAKTDETAEAGTLTLGAERTAAALTEAQLAFLAEKGYTVIAVLPEMTADASAQYDLEAELDEDAPEGEKMFWIAFPDAEPSEDDEIVDFYDEAGAPVEGVPASHKIIASPWLREGVTYEPVIAIEAK
ncbi:MAG: hypothetical protein IJS28_05020 [Synergistaceae bacterium]|nr:hypothetical protein [Synergistaceae bacterium]